MEAIHEPIAKDKLIQELQQAEFVKYTRKSGNEIYIFNYQQAPNLMIEVARLREITFRDAGGGTGKNIDLDYFDVGVNPYQQLIVWNPRDREIVGGYRFAVCRNYIAAETKRADLSMANYFVFSDDFMDNYLPKSIELGRAWIQPYYQAGGARSIFALDNLWDGLGALIHNNPDIDYLYGKLTTFQSYNAQAREILLWFLDHYYGKDSQLVVPYQNFDSYKRFDYDNYYFNGIDINYDLRVLSKALRSEGENIPPLIGAYIGLARNLKIFGTAFNADFGNTFETGMLLSIADIYPEKLERYTSVYQLEVA